MLLIKKNIAILSLLILPPYLLMGQSLYEPGPVYNEDMMEKLPTASSEFYPYLSLQDMEKGMQFLLPPNRFKVMESLKGFYKTDEESLSHDERTPLRYDDYALETFVLQEVEEAELNGDKIALFKFEIPERGESLTFETRVNPEALSNTAKYYQDNVFPYLIYQDDIDQFREQLVGDTVYTRYSYFYQYHPELNSNYVYRHNRKFIPAIITAVGAGTHKKPVRVVFETRDGKRGFYDIVLSGTNVPQEKEDWQQYSFSHYFFSENPRNWYEGNEETWNLIQTEQAAPGMTVNEILLALGQPDQIAEKNLSLSADEKWSYGSNYELFFEDGKVSSIRNKTYKTEIQPKVTPDN